MTTHDEHADAASRAAALLSELTAGEPRGSWSAPGRVNLIGEHTDYNDGFVLPFAIDRRTSVVAAERSDGMLRVASTFADEPVEVALADLPDLFPGSDVPEWAAYPIGVAWAAVAASGISPTRGLDLAIASDVPVGAGLSSSAAIEGATAAALNDLWSLGFDAVALARIGRTAENDAVGAPTGIMDQMAAMLGRTDAAIFLDCRSLDTDVVDLGFAAAGLDVLVIDTGVKHSHATGGYRDRRDSCERGAHALGVPALRDVSVGDLARAQRLLDDTTFRRVRHIVTENERVRETVATLRAEGPRAIGGLLLASHASMRDDFEISVPELDTAVEVAVATGAIGARMTGGGFGGAAIALVEHAAVERVGDAVRAAFDAAGYGAPTIFTVAASEGARRDT
ncbi:Galactokinase [Microbacterium lemovicicum]|uniref:Galactokinase n=1 Tax=Microbacterium lemovicicum TaxID=1072463 RepID=A0A3Q9J5F9_9MICO|nr:galactokinase [Microbacterium lemovicicum]AZS38210.1 Galactokinase [Microbacterium lemovicicum]